MWIWTPTEVLLAALLIAGSFLVAAPVAGPDGGPIAEVQRPADVGTKPF